MEQECWTLLFSQVSTSFATWDQSWKELQIKYKFFIVCCFGTKFSVFTVHKLATQLASFVITVDRQL
jgi:hypothetical protein